MRKYLILFLTTLLSSLLLIAPSGAAELEKLRVGVLKFGTVNWTLNVLKHHKLDEKYGIELEIIPLASKNASHVAVQGGGAEIIVSDWIWVSRQRAAGRDYTFVPYSNATGALMVDQHSGFDTLADLKGQKLGIAGGPLDKSWLFLRAYAEKYEGLDLATALEPNYAAPPLLNKLVQRGELDAALNFWHYTARLQATGFKSILTISEVLTGLGIESTMPVIGWVFSEQWANENNKLLQNFVYAAREAQQILFEQDAEWLRIRDSMKTQKEAVFNALREAYRLGVPGCYQQSDTQAAIKAFAILAKLGGKKLVGESDKLAKGTFWGPYQTMECKS